MNATAIAIDMGFKVWAGIEKSTAPRTRAVSETRNATVTFRRVKNISGQLIKKHASSEEFVGDGEGQRAVSLRNLRNFRHVESNDLC